VISTGFFHSSAVAAGHICSRLTRGRPASCPEEMVAREREKEASFREQIEKLQEKLKVFQNP